MCHAPRSRYAASATEIVQLRLRCIVEPLVARRPVSETSVLSVEEALAAAVGAPAPQHRRADGVRQARCRRAHRWHLQCLQEFPELLPVPVRMLYEGLQ
mmetsp:Transcript_23846/g.65928  ORF Transcript_23846/g.65928 Transcript_23846/m.65928 type:complete len:99 (+) Transcript_23846:2092-2388(+)